LNLLRQARRSATPAGARLDHRPRRQGAGPNCPVRQTDRGTLACLPRAR